MADLIVFDATGGAMLWEDFPADKQSIQVKTGLSYNPTAVKPIQFLYKDTIYLIALQHALAANYATIECAIEGLKPSPFKVLQAKKSEWQLWQYKSGCSPTVLASFQSYPTVKQLVEECKIDLLIAGSLAANKHHWQGDSLLELYKVGED